ncbi:alpha-amylase [Flavobacterium sp. ANB]|uniref:alpha-amylase family glycosyl hydrolase n=1 Tax=unclassified Flavobacterium TaxID=196869 RepID=UPI0012B7D2E9|nr:MULTISPECIES: alpha-amylase family glycosyl hydrolase [unclassified Flavobacterium]MBF4515145.1 alpha-amylase [Flavobacterium sp. ANB]MTD70057.1 alpha-amylase [Flavobacterium sp. LC2016-13]
MKFNINIVYSLLLTLAFVSCSSSDDDSNTNPAYPQYGTSFEKMPNKADAIIYQVNIRAFSQAGTLKGVQDRLTQIQELGANVIYLMPIYPVGKIKASGELGSPYAVQDYKAVNPDFGTLEDLRTLVDEAHKKNMAVVLDWVANHTSWDNAWITDHKNWYQQDDKGNIIIPPGTNYTDVAQLNFNNAEMKAAMIDAMSYWIYTANVDGFRCDYADFVPQTFWSEAITKLRSIKKNQTILMLAEGSKTDHFASGFDYTFGFNFFSTLEKVFKESKPATTIQDSNTTEYANNYNQENRIVRYTSNHDVNFTDGTPLELFGGKQGSVATFVVAAYMKSVPMIYNGQEIGYNKRLNYFAKTPIDWSTADASVLAEYKKIIAFRNTSNAIKRGTYTGYSNNVVSAFTMVKDAEKVLVLSNLTNNAAKYLVSPALKGTWKDAFTGTAVTVGAEITLEPFQYLVLKN